MIAPHYGLTEEIRTQELGAELDYEACTNRTASS